MNGYVEENKSLTEQVLSNIDEKYIRMTLADLDGNAASGEKKAACGNRGTDRLPGQRKRHGWRWMACRAAVCLLLVCALSFTALATATAAGSLTAYQALHTLYPEVAVRLTPVNETCVDKGILMVMDGINVDGSHAYIYISLQDTTGDDRIDSSIDLFDSYSIHTTCDQIGGCTLVRYEAEEGRCSYLISIEQADEQEIAGEKITFSVSELLCGKKNTNKELAEICLANVREADKLQAEVPVRGRAGTLSEYSEEMQNKFLVPDEQLRFSPTDGAWITGCALVDGVLHIQAYYEDILKYDNHGFVYLKDAEGNIRNCLASIAFWDEERSGSYEEYIFNLEPGDRLEDYTVWGDFTTCRDAIKGNWKVSCLIQEQQDP